MAKVVIFGTREIARMAHHYLSTDSEHEVVAFTVDRAYLKSDSFCSLPVVPFEHIKDTYPPDRHAMFIAVSYTQINQLRAQKFEAAKTMGYSLITYVSSKCTYLSEFPPGENCMILENNTIQPLVKIGNNNILWICNVIGHGVQINDHCFVAGNVAIGGESHIHDYCFLGPSATLIGSITLAPQTLVTAGCTILNDTVEGGVYYMDKPKLHRKKSDQINY